MNVEFNLMCLVARVDFSPEAAQYAIHLVQSGSVNWSAFLARVERHYIAPLVHKNLKSISCAGVPPKVLDTLRVRSKLTAFRSEQFAAELVRLGSYSNPTVFGRFITRVSSLHRNSTVPLRSAISTTWIF